MLSLSAFASISPPPQARAWKVSSLKYMILSKKCRQGLPCPPQQAPAMEAKVASPLKVRDADCHCLHTVCSKTMKSWPAIHWAICASSSGTRLAQSAMYYVKRDDDLQNKDKKGLATGNKFQ